MKIEANKFKTRSDLLNYIESEFGIDSEANSRTKHTIEGTRDELRQLFLSDRVKVYGIKCVITDTPTDFQKGQRKRPDRGTQVPFGINQRNLKPPK